VFYRRVKQVFGFGDVVDDSSTPFSLIAGATTNATLVKAAPGVLVGLHAINQSAAVKYLKFYDTRQLPAAGSGTPVRRYAIPANTTGAGFVIPFFVPARFLVGIAFTITGAQADNDTTVLSAGDVTLTGEFI
jgi:hypothetical protein